MDEAGLHREQYHQQSSFALPYLRIGWHVMDNLIEICENPETGEAF
jgi:hypothetical protein